MSSNQEGSNPQNLAIAGAPTQESRPEQNEEPTPNQPRQPRCFQSLMRFAIEASRAEDVGTDAAVQQSPMDQERRRFLEDALQSFTTNVLHKMQNSLNMLSDQEKISSIKPSDALPTDVRAAFHLLLDYIDDMDVANDFYKMGGFAMFPVCFGSENDEVRALAYRVLGELCQNNSYCQSRVLETGLLNVLLSALSSEQDEALAKCIFAISCACRSWEPSCKELVAQGCLPALAECLRSRTRNVKIKASFFVRYLCVSYEPAKEQFIEMNLVRIVSEEIQKGFDEGTEHLARLLDEFTQVEPRAVEQCQDPALGLRRSLLAVSKKEEVAGYCHDLMKRIFDDFVEQEPVADNVAER